MTESIVQMLIEFQQLGALTLGSLFQAHHPLMKTPFLLSSLSCRNESKQYLDLISTFLSSQRH